MQKCIGCIINGKAVQGHLSKTYCMKYVGRDIRDLQHIWCNFYCSTIVYTICILGYPTPLWSIAKKMFAYMYMKYSDK